MKENLIRLADFNPGNEVSLDRGMDIGPEIASSHPPAFGEVQNQEVTGPKKNIVGGDDLLFSFGRHGRESDSGLAHLFLKEGFQLDFIPARIFPLLVDDKDGITKNPVTDGFVNSLKGLSIDDPDEDILPVFPRQLPDPVREVEVILLQIIRVLVEIMVVSLGLQTHLVCHELTRRSGVE